MTNVLCKCHFLLLKVFCFLICNSLKILFHSKYLSDLVLKSVLAQRNVIDNRTKVLLSVVDLDQGWAFFFTGFQVIWLCCSNYYQMFHYCLFLGPLLLFKNIQKPWLGKLLLQGKTKCLVLIGEVSSFILINCSTGCLL